MVNSSQGPLGASETHENTAKILGMDDFGGYPAVNFLTKEVGVMLYFTCHEQLDFSCLHYSISIIFKIEHIG